MRIVYKPEDQEVIDKHQTLIKERVVELESHFLALDIFRKWDAEQMVKFILNDPYIKLLQSDLNRFIMTRTETRWIL